MRFQEMAQAIRKKLPLRYCGAVIVAAGHATRMGGIDKITTNLGGEPIIKRTVRAFAESEVIREIVIVTRQEQIPAIKALCAEFEKVTKVVPGGPTRPESVAKGLEALSGRVRLAAIQDGARPLITAEVIERTVRAADVYGAAAPGVPVKDTTKEVSEGLVTRTPERNSLYAVQTPQVFDYDLLRGALVQADRDRVEVTDDCSAVERIGMSVRIVEGDERNIKITTPRDLKIAALFLEELA